MALTKVSYSMINGAPFNVLDYSSLATTFTAKSPGNPASHLFASFLSWKLPIQAALDACYNAGGGTVVLPKNTVPYYIDDVIFVKDNTTLICEDWIILADYTTGGGAFGANGENIVIQNLKLDCSNIYAGGSGENGIGAGAGASGVGKNIKFYGGIVKNCSSGNNNDGTGDGGKGCQIEPGDCEDILIDGMTFSNCFMAMSTIRDYGTADPYNGIIFSNITADTCRILFFVRQVDGAQSQTGLQHSVQLNNFYALNCGAFEGVMQFSRASNVIVSNGIVVNSSAATALIRGNHANCQFVNIGFYGNSNTVVQLDPSTYAVDSSQANTNNRYDIQVWGQVSTFANASISTPYRTLQNCFGSFQARLAPTTGWFGYELRNGTSVFNLVQGDKAFIASTSLNFDTNGSGNPSKFSDLDIYTSTAQYNAVRLGNANLTSPGDLDWYEEGTWTPTFLADSGTGAVYTSSGTYIRVGGTVTVSGEVSPTNFGTLADRIFIGGLPFNNVSTPPKVGGAVISHATLASACSVACEIGGISNSQISFPWMDNAGGGGDAVSIGDVVAGTSYFYFSLTYFAV
jgi:hypothetical protein